MSQDEGPRRSTRIRNQLFLQSNLIRNHSFQLLPAEIRAEIFSKIPQPEVGILRLVCKQWAEDIKNAYNYAIKFKEDSPRYQLRHILQLRIVNLEIKKMSKNPIPTFKYPILISKMSIGHELSPNTVKAFLQLCQTTLKFLNLQISPQLVSHQFPTPITYNFQNLNALHLSLGFYPDFSQNDIKICASICSNFGNSSLPNIKTLKMKLWQDSNLRRMTENDDAIMRNNTSAVDFILKLATKNPTGLEKLSIKMKYDYSPSARRELPLITTLPQLSHSDLEVLKTVRKLKYIRFDLYVLEQRPANEALLLHLIGRQECLEELDLYRYDVLFPADLLKSISVTNQETLLSIALCCLSLNQDRPFDLSIFKTCSRLHTLSLDRRTRAPLDSSEPQLINLSSLPDSLQCFLARSFNILSEDLLEFVRSDIVRFSLAEIDLLCCGFSGNFGVNLSVLEIVVDLKCRNLQVIRMFVNWGTAEEGPKRREILDKLGRTEEPGGPGSPGLSLFRNEFNELRPVVGWI